MEGANDRDFLGRPGRRLRRILITRIRGIRSLFIPFISKYEYHNVALNK